jgi:hypothetical protein
VKIDAVKRRSKGSKRFELLIKTTKVIMLNQKKNEEKTKRKSPNPTLGGMKSILARKSKEKVRDKHK